MALNVSCIWITSKTQNTIWSRWNGVWDDFYRRNAQKRIDSVAFPQRELNRCNVGRSLLIVKSDVSKIDIMTRKEGKNSSLVNRFFAPGFRKVAANKVQNLFAAGSAAIAATAFVEVSDNFLHTLESVPFLAELELLVGFFVSTNLLIKVFGSEDERVRIGSWMENLKEKIFGSNEFGVVFENEPSMLDVQILSIVNEYTKNDDKKDNSSFQSSKQELVDALKGFILNREIQSRKINFLLRKDLEKFKNEEANGKVAQDELNSLRSIMALQEQKLSSLMEENNALLNENEKEKERLLEMNAVVVNLNSKIENELKVKEEMSLKNMELHNQYEKILKENKLWSERFSTFENEVNEMRSTYEAEKNKLTEELQTEIKSRREERGNMMWLEAQLEALKADRDEKNSVIFALQTALENSKIDKALMESEITALNNNFSQQNSNPLLELPPSESINPPFSTIQTIEQLDASPSQLDISLEGVNPTVNNMELGNKASASILVNVQESENAVDEKIEKEENPILKLTDIDSIDENEDDDAELKSELAEKEFKAYAKSISELYIDPKKTYSQQLKSINLFTEALVEKGATREWATNYSKYLLKYERRKLKKRSQKKSSPS